MSFVPHRYGYEIIFVIRLVRARSVTPCVCARGSRLGGGEGGEGGGYRRLLITVDRRPPASALKSINIIIILFV